MRLLRSSGKRSISLPRSWALATRPLATQALMVVLFGGADVALATLLCGMRPGWSSFKSINTPAAGTREATVARDVKRRGF